MSTVRVLCVENHLGYLEALKFMLERVGYEVVAATTGDEGLSLLTSQSFHGVLLENDLPGATGSSVRTKMKQIKPDVPVLLFTGVSSQTPFLIRFFDAYLRNAGQPDWAFHDLDA